MKSGFGYGYGHRAKRSRSCAKKHRRKAKSRGRRRHCISNTSASEPKTSADQASSSETTDCPPRRVTCTGRKRKRISSRRKRRSKSTRRRRVVKSRTSSVSPASSDSDDSSSLSEVPGTSGVKSKTVAASRGGESKKVSGAGATAKDGKDEIVHFSWSKGMLLHSRFLVSRKLGDGTFGRVLQAYDQEKYRQVAVKVVRDVEKYTRNAKREMQILKAIRKADPNGDAFCVVMHRTFIEQDRFFCLVFEVLGSSLYDFLEKNEFRGFFVQDIVFMARRCLQALAFLHEKLNLAHTDLKLENILFQHKEVALESEFPRAEFHRSRGLRASGPYLRPRRSAVKLIDFGNATYEHEHHSSVINTRQYRGPEVLLALGWDERSDMWSLGCCCMELYTGELLFHTHDNMEHLALMERILEPLPSSLLRRATEINKDKYLTECPQAGSSSHLRIAWPEKAASPKSQTHVQLQRPLAKQALQHHKGFVDFVRSLLVYEVLRRPSATEALKHSVFQEPFRD